MKEAYAYRNSKDITLESSSGGAYWGVLSTCFKNSLGGGIAVYGAAFDDDLRVNHQRVLSLEECKAFHGSKYVQSNLGRVFTSIYDDLNNGLNVIFSGTPCQVNALNGFLERKSCDTEGLLTIDILCHGTPAPRLWEDFKNWLENKYDSKLVEFSFRYKGDGKKRRMKYPVYARFENGKTLEDSYLTRLYVTLYFTQLTFRDCCYKCKFSSSERCSDITVGDFWQYKRAMKKEIPQPDLGMSLILTNSDKGSNIAKQMISEAVCDSAIYMEECNVDDLLKVQETFGAVYEKSSKVNAFREDYRSHGIEYILKKYAGYNFKGHLKHVLKKTVTKIGLLPIIDSLRGH